MFSCHPLLKSQTKGKEKSHTLDSPTCQLVFFVILTSVIRSWHKQTQRKKNSILFEQHKLISLSSSLNNVYVPLTLSPPCPSPSLLLICVHLPSLLCIYVNDAGMHTLYFGLPRPPQLRLMYVLITWSISSFLIFPSHILIIWTETQTLQKSMIR